MIVEAALDRCALTRHEPHPLAAPGEGEPQRVLQHAVGNPSAPQREDERLVSRLVPDGARAAYGAQLPCDQEPRQQAHTREHATPNDP